MILKFLRKRKNMKLIMWGIAILIVPAFVIWGVGTSLRQRKGPDYAGKIFNRKVSFEEYERIWRSTRDFVESSYGANIPEELIHDMVWNRLILLEEAKHQNIRVSDKEVIKKITELPIFQRNNRFDRALYKSMLQEGARNFEESIRDDLVIAKLKSKIVSGVTITDEELKEEFKKENEKIRTSYILIKPKDFENQVTYSEDELKTHYEKNKEKFRTEEKVNVEYIGFEYESDEQREEAEEKSFDIVKRLKDKSFEEVAKENSLTIKETGLFSMNEPIPEIGFSYPFLKEAFRLKPGETSQPIKTEKGSYIFRVKEKIPPYIPQFEEAKERVRQSLIIELTWQKAKENIDQLYTNIKQALSENKTFEDITKELGLELKTTEYLTLNSYIPGVGPGGEFTELAFRIKVGEIGGPVQTTAGYCILRLDEFQGIDEKRFEEEKNSFKEKVLISRRQAIFDRYLEELRKKASLISNIKI